MGNQLGLQRALGCEIFMVKACLCKRWENEDGFFKIYSQIEGRKKNLVPKLDSLMKHSSLHKCTKAKRGVVVGQFFSCLTNQHVKMRSCLHLQIMTQMLFK
jgi:hypothetical protein